MPASNRLEYAGDLHPTFSFIWQRKEDDASFTVIKQLSLRTQKWGKEPEEVEIDSEIMVGEVLRWGAESCFKPLYQDMVVGCVSHWISTVS